METLWPHEPQPIPRAWVVIRGIPKEGWKHVGVAVGTDVTSGVVIRGIPKEGWKRVTDGAGVLVTVGVVIRGIPKEGWKPARAPKNDSRISRW